MRYRRIIALTAYAGTSCVAYTIAFLLRFEFAVPTEFNELWLRTLPLLILVRVFGTELLGLSSSRWRFAGTHDVLRLALANCIGTAAFFGIAVAIGFVPAIPRSVVVLEWLLTTFGIAALWIAYRTAFEQVRHFRAGFNGSARRVIIVGAGEGGHLLAREMTRWPTGYRPVGFVDDEPTKHGTTIHGLKVFGSVDDIPRIVERTRAEELVIAIPSAKPEELRRVVEICEKTDLSFKVLPGIRQVLSGQVELNQLRELRIDDLLGRDPIQLELPELYDELHGQTVLITGAAGSIGSELARQVALHSPGTLILFDQAETPLFYLDQELRRRHPDLRIVAIVGDVVDAPSVERVFNLHHPSRVYHAPAYKHVPSMQFSPREALRNNTLGTWVVADAAGRHEAVKFVLVSTDKAVRPSSVMGATKRLAEIALDIQQDRHPETTYSAVRFGNVLGSNGSVIPLFQRQIAERQPITLTHPEATRYFMTIPEAVQLILQASLLPQIRGSVAMLEMGEPVRIVELAKAILRLSGLPFLLGRTYTITGLRPGEKLHEELWAPDEAAFPTQIPKVKIVQPSDISMRRLDLLLDQWEEAFRQGDEEEVTRALHALFPSLKAHYEEDEAPHGQDRAVLPDPHLGAATPSTTKRSAAPAGRALAVGTKPKP